MLPLTGTGFTCPCECRDPLRESDQRGPRRSGPALRPSTPHVPPAVDKVRVGATGCYNQYTSARCVRLEISHVGRSSERRSKISSWSTMLPPVWEWSNFFEGAGAQRTWTWRTLHAAGPATWRLTVKRWRHLALVAGADDTAEDDGDGHRYGEPRDDQPENPVHMADNDPKGSFVTDE